MIERILPAPVVVAETFGTPPQPPPLFPEEDAYVADAVAKRRLEFSTVRACARQALGELGLPPVALIPGERGAPQWPAGVVGTMTHCAGYRAAALARTGDLAAIGLDAEPNDPLDNDGVLALVTLPEERAWLRPMAARYPGVHWDRLVFSAKESVYKTWYPLTRRWLDFEEASVTVDPDAGTFTARLLTAGPVVAGRRLDVLHGRFVARDGLLLTAIAVRADGTFL